MLKMGDMVKVRVPAETTGNTVRKFNGKVAVIRRVSRYYGGQCYFELVGIKSDKGVPYAFTADWLTEVD